MCENMSEMIKLLGYSPAKWEDDSLVLLNQSALPLKEEYLTLRSVEDVVRAIGDLTVRGAPLIGIVAAYGLCLIKNPLDETIFQQSCERLANIRPTAVNLRWSIERMAAFRRRNLQCDNLRELMVGEARQIHIEDA